jgi:hypothetical protein
VALRNRSIAAIAAFAACLLALGGAAAPTRAADSPPAATEAPPPQTDPRPPGTPTPPATPARPATQTPPATPPTPIPPDTSATPATPTPPAAPPPRHPIRPLSVFDPIPTKGDFRALTVLVDFPDQPGIFPQEAFARQLFGTWPTGSWADFYREASYGQLRYSGDVVGLRNGAPVANSGSVAFVRLPNPHSFYANNENGFGDDFPRNNSGVVYHALQALDAAGFDFAPRRRRQADPDADRRLRRAEPRGYLISREPGGDRLLPAHVPAGRVHVAGRLPAQQLHILPRAGS